MITTRPPSAVAFDERLQAVAGFAVAGLPHPRIEAEVADKLPCRVEATDVADRRHEHRGGVHADARDRHQPQDLRRAERLGGQRRLERLDPSVEDIDLGAATEAQTPTGRRLDRPCQAAPGRAAESRGALDFQFDTTVDGRTVELLHVVDERTREALAIEVARSIDADHTVRVLDRIVPGRRVVPELLRSDNGPGPPTPCDWCRLGGTGSDFIEPGSPWQNLRPRRSPRRRGLQLTAGSSCRT